MGQFESTESYVHCIIKQKSILERGDEQEVKIAAAIEIQRVWRGYYTRL